MMYAYLHASLTPVCPFMRIYYYNVYIYTCMKIHVYAYLDALHYLPLWVHANTYMYTCTYMYHYVHVYGRTGAGRPNCLEILTAVL